MSVRTPSLLYAVKQVELAVRSQLDELLKPDGITTVQYTALTVLERREDLTAAELARGAFVTPQAMGDVVAALHARGLVQRTRDPGNRRRLVLTLTPTGRAMLAGRDADVRALERRMVMQLSPRQVDVLADLLNLCRLGLSAGSPRR